MKIAEIKEALNNNPSEKLLAELAQDERSGVQKLLAAYYKKQQAEAAERERFAKMLLYEKQCYESGAQYVAGVDEAGRGPLAGPMVIGAVILPPDVFIKGLNDSKKLTAAKREQLYDEILAKALAVSVNIVSVYNIDRMNIYRATQEGMAQVLENLKIRPQAALIDAMPVQAEGIRTYSVIHGDTLSVSIAAASVIAKVTRDRMMDKLAQEYPQYGWEHNKGYGSGAHMQAILEYGATCWHRRSYEPVKSMNLPEAEHVPNKLIRLPEEANG